MSSQQIDHRLLQRRDQRPHAKTQSSHVQQAVKDDLARTVIGHLTAAIHLNDGNFTRRPQVFRFAGQALGKDRRMLDPPQFVWRIGVRVAVKVCMAANTGAYRTAPQAAKPQQLGMGIGAVIAEAPAYSTILICGWPLRSR
jgi:hypothetical protein